MSSYFLCELLWIWIFFNGLKMEKAVESVCQGKKKSRQADY